MDTELKDKIEKAKATNTVKKKPCTSCKKKKKVITELPQVIDMDELMEELYIPTEQEIHLAYVELGNKDEDKKEFINKVYKFLFNEDFDFGCQSCVNRQSRRLKNYINEHFELKVN